MSNKKILLSEKIAYVFVVLFGCSYFVNGFYPGNLLEPLAFILACLSFTMLIVARSRRKSISRTNKSLMTKEIFLFYTIILFVMSLFLVALSPNIITKSITYVFLLIVLGTLLYFKKKHNEEKNKL